MNERDWFCFLYYLLVLSAGAMVFLLAASAGFFWTGLILGALVGGSLGLISEDVFCWAWARQSRSVR